MPHCYFEIGLDGKPFASSEAAPDSFSMFFYKETTNAGITIVRQENDD